jgi:hypothetical protein
VLSEVGKGLSKKEVELSKKELHKMATGNLTMRMICSSDLPWLWYTF